MKPPTARTWWKPGTRAVLWGGAAGLLLAVGFEAARVLLGRNLHAVVPGRVYRCAQQSAEGLEQIVRDRGIRTVINLRGCSAAFAWYQEECRATAGLDIAQEDICLSSGRLPSATEIRRLMEVLDRCEYPLLLHCRRGADRTGLVSALVLLLQTDASLTEARRQLGPRYGHVPVGKAGYLDQFLEVYIQWLKEQRLQHSCANLRRWIEGDYCPAAYRCTIEPVEPPARLPLGKARAFPVRVTNTSVRSWRLCPDNNAGVHGVYALLDAHGRLAATGRAGLFDAEVAPGESIELKFALPGLKSPGRYRLIVDMVDEQQGWFYQFGSEPLEREIEVGD